MADSYSPVVAVVDFHHQRYGPEVERWVGVEEGYDPAIDNDWQLLPFLALSDGAHAATEDFSYFTLVLKSTPERSLFGISCTRQLDSRELLNRPADVTRSTVQKAVVVITENPQTFTAIREKLSVVTKAWFAQKDFGDIEILERFQESLNKGFGSQEDDRDLYFGLSMRELIHQFKWQTLVLFKCLLLQPKMLFFGSNCEKMCLVQFSLISLIPTLMRHLRDCADPRMDYYATHVEKPTSLKTSERASLLAYMGVPLQIFGKGSLFGPYTPLQQLDTLADQHTKSYVVGSTNQLLLQQKDRYADILVNLDDNTINIHSPSLRNALALSTADRRWIDFLTQSVHDTWDENIPSRPKDMGYAGSEEFIRLQFEEYLLSLLSASKYSRFVSSHKGDPKALLSEVEGDPAMEFGSEFMNQWSLTENYALFERTTDSHLFDVVEPRHPCAGGLTIEDVQRRLAAQVSELHLDERWRGSKEAVGKHISTGRERVAGAINTLWADIEVMREAQRKRVEEQKAAAAVAAANNPPAPDEKSAPKVVQAQASVQAASSRAGAYLSSWGAWASEKRKNWQKPENNAAVPTTATLPPTQIWEAEDSRPAVTTVSELGRTGQAQPAPLPRDKVETANKANKDEDEEEEDTQKTQQEDIATQVAAEDPWVQEKI
ncbi:hypothetical protein D6C77_06187 [Aureobasidium pullulans]|uniref:UDENN domain-containing protein n=2 Tax=Aureobasidium pullulans TaxID=5580 RepID=A0A4S9ERF1_AURPU|nr:hypothetical protein D6D21_10490 [Aureobasidium pullulans]THW53839.1 hypothetical protein D6D25_03908 [Aureobasidium pullulans]THW88326.1 hypothetical protein D6D15_06040 [Aureobasidium pullulans]THX37341.1 hypothetical protein D6D10_05947 [Aureobasidium pullulans]THX84400.1 hypothetical protein D6D04_02450 [Aureobasidium pullulans]